MSFHGGALGVAIAIILFASRHHLRWLRIIDYVAMCAPIGLLLGRLTNFVNDELWGRPTTLPWGIVFPNGGPLPRHPVNSTKPSSKDRYSILILWCLFRFSHARKRPGVLSGAFILGYGTVRFLVEFVREPDSQLADFARQTGLHMGQWLRVTMVVGGASLIVWAGRPKPIA